MTSELEQEFYDTFGIEPKHNKKSCKHCKYHTESNFYDGCIRDINFIDCPNAKMFYPKITDRKLLEMICILNSIYDCGFKNNTSLASKEVKYLKMEILKHCILHKEQIKTQIQQLFKEA